MKSGHVVQLPIGLPREMVEVLRKSAFDRCVSQASIVREALAEYLGIPIPEVKRGRAPGRVEREPDDIAKFMDIAKKEHSQDPENA